MHGHIGRHIGCLLRGNAELQESFLVVLRLVCRILQIQPLVREVPDVFILGVVGFATDLQRHVVCFRIGDLFLTGFDAPFPPRCDDGHVRGKCLDCHFEADLVVALAGAAVADSVRAFGKRDLHNSLGDGRAGKRGAEHIVFVQRTSLHAGEYVIGQEILRDIFDVDLGSAGLQRLLFQPLQLVRLTDIGGNRNDFGVVVIFLQPRNDNGRIKTAGICQNDFFDLFAFHDKNLVFMLIFQVACIIIHDNPGFVKRLSENDAYL